MDKYVVSRELAERLKMAGYPQEGEFSYYQINMMVMVMRSNVHNDAVYSLICAAPLSDELQEQLPDYTKSFKRNGKEDFKTVKGRYAAGCISLNTNSPHYANGHEFRYADKPADALAQLWLWCKQNGHIV